MKKIIKTNIKALSLFMLTVSLLTCACRKDSDGSPDMKPGNLQVGTIAPDSASGGTLLVVKGTGLGAIRSIMFEKGNVPASFYTTLNTETVIQFRVPDTAYGGPQNIVFKNSAGDSTLVPFKVLAFASVNAASNYDFTGGSEITLSGNNLEDVISVSLTGTSDEATIVSANKKSLVIKMPSSTVNRATLDIVNSTGLSTTTQEFINIDQAYQIFTDNYANGFGDGSWGSGAFISTTEYKTGTASVAKTYQKGNWHLINFANWWPGCANEGYKYLTFWVKGASEDYTLYLTGDKRAAGFGNSDQSTPVNVPANLWTYFKFNITDIKLWANGTPFNQLGFWIKGPDKQDETFYFDDVLLVK